jgi:hypothetical protein
VGKACGDTETESFLIHESEHKDLFGIRVHSDAGDTAFFVKLRCELVTFFDLFDRRASRKWNIGWCGFRHGYVYFY